MSFLHVHKRRVPTQDVYRSIVVGMRAETAMTTVEDRLAFAALPVHGSAFRTGLRGIGRVDGNERAAPFLQLVAKDGGEAAPSLIENAPVETGFLPDVPARFLDGAFRARRHSGDAQVFHDDHGEPVGEISADLVMPVTADAGALGGQASAALYCPEPALRPLLSPRHDTLCGTVATVDGFEAGRDGQALASGKRKRIRNASINADRRRNIGWRYVFDFAGERYVPTESVEAHGSILDYPSNRARVTEFYPSDLWQANSRPLAVDLTDFDFPPLETEGVVDALLVRCWVSSTSSEEVSECLVKIAKGLLLAGLRNGGDPIVFGAKQGKVSTLLCEIEPMYSPPYLPLLQREIVYEATNASKLPENVFLISRRMEFESEPAMHSHEAGLVSIDSDLGRASALGLSLAPRPPCIDFSTLNINQKARFVLGRKSEAASVEMR